MPKVEVAIAFYTVAAWRINRRMRLGRECPELDASLVFEPDEWMAAYILNDKEPPKEVWQGMEKVASFVAGVKFARQMEDRH